MPEPLWPARTRAGVNSAKAVRIAAINCFIEGGLYQSRSTRLLSKYQAAAGDRALGLGDFTEINSRHVVAATLQTLARAWKCSGTEESIVHQHDIGTSGFGSIDVDGGEAVESVDANPLPVHEDSIWRDERGR